MTVSVAFSPDSSRLATVSSDSTIKICNAVTGAGPLTLTGHAGLVADMAFSPADGTHMVTASLDATVCNYVLPIEDRITLAKSRLAGGFSLEE